MNIHSIKFLRLVFIYIILFIVNIIFINFINKLTMLGFISISSTVIGFVISSMFFIILAFKPVSDIKLSSYKTSYFICLIVIGFTNTFILLDIILHFLPRV